MEMLISIFFNSKFALELLIAENLFMARNKRRPYFGLKMALLVILSVGVSVLLSFDRMGQFLPELFPLGGVIRYLAVLACTLLCMAGCYECQLYQLLMYGIGGYAVQHIAYSAHELIQLLRAMAFPESGKLDSFYLISFAVVYLAVYYLLNRTLIRSISSQTYPVKLWTILLLSAGVLLNILVFSLCTYAFDDLQLILFRLLSVTTCLLALFVLKNLMEVRHLQRDMEFIRQLSIMKGDYYEFLKESITATNIRCHDFKHQISQLRRGKKDPALADTLDDLERSINIYDSISKTGSEALDIVLTEKSLICRQENIRFTYMVDSERLNVLEDRDIYALFGNVLDNAIEAVRALSEPEKKVISLSVLRKGQLLNIHIYNFFETHVHMVDGLPQTTKSDLFAHGYGMKSIRMIVDKYQGEMQVTASDHIFDLNLVIPLE